MSDKVHTLPVAGLVLAALASTAAALIFVPVARKGEPPVSVGRSVWVGSAPVLQPLLSTLQLVPPERLLSPKPWARPQRSRATSRVLLHLI